MPAPAQILSTRSRRHPLTSREVSVHRAIIAHDLRHEDGLPFAAIAQILNLTPERARAYVAKAARLYRTGIA